MELPGHVEDLGKAVTNLAKNYQTAAQFYRQQAADPDWEGGAADAARAKAMSIAATQDEKAATLSAAASQMKDVETEAEGVSLQVKAVLNYAAAPPQIKIDPATNEVTPRDTSYYTDDYAAQVQAKAADVEAKVAAVLAEGEGVDEDLATAMAMASIEGPSTQLVHTWKQGGGKNGPQIDGKGTDPVEEPQSGSPYDLGVTIPGTGIVITGDPETGKPQLIIPGTKWHGDNPFPTQPGYRALPTGTAVGPDGQKYAFYSIKPYGSGTSPDNYIGAESHVQNLGDPTKDLGPLRGTVPGSNVPVGISQASGVYDPKSNRMVIVGNVGQNGQRALWESDPVRPGDPPNAWMNSMHQVGTFSNLGAGDRENQIVALPDSKGYLLTSAKQWCAHRRRHRKHSRGAARRVGNAAHRSRDC